MTAEQLALEVGALPPQRGACPACGREVVVVDVGGVDVACEVGEVQPVGPCPDCPREGQCSRCGGSRVVGEEYPPHGVVIDADGNARPWGLGDRLRQGEAVMRVHACADS